MLLGSFPAGAGAARAQDEYRERIVAYMRKACREAKVRTSWARVNEAYEAATTGFVNALLDARPGNAFLDDLRAASEPIAWAGFLNSLAMAAVKYTSPGVPDCYQGNELIDLSLVDPDNRRPVDYALRARMLGELAALAQPPDTAALRAIFASAGEGRAKLYVTWRLLQLRQEREVLFRDGGYAALRTRGEHGRHVVAFARRLGKDTVVTVVPRLTTTLGVAAGELPCGAAVWGDTRVEMPFLPESARLRDAITGAERRVRRGGIALAELLEAAPVAVLVA